MRGGFFRFWRASANTAGICFSRSTAARSRVFTGAYGRSMMTKIEFVTPLEYRSGFFSQPRITSSCSSVRANVVQQDIAIRRGLRIQRARVDRRNLLFPLMQRSDFLRDACSRVVLKLRVVLVQARGGARRRRKFKIDLLKYCSAQEY